MDPGTSTHAVAQTYLVHGLGYAGRTTESFGGARRGGLALVAMLFAALFPHVLPSTTDPAYSLTIADASSTTYTLAIMSWVALSVTPFVLAYQAWTYWVFRRRISRKSIPTTVPHGAATQPGR